MRGVQLCQEGQDLEICHQVRNGAWHILIGVIPGVENLPLQYYMGTFRRNYNSKGEHN